MTVIQQDKPIMATKPFAIFTLAVGEQSIEQHALTGPQMEAYADRVGADYHVINDDHYPHYSLANKFRLRTLAANYDRALYLDADVWIRPTAPNVFEQFSADKVWMHADRKHLENPDSLIINYVTIASQQRVARILDYDCLNSGVVLFSRDHLHLWTPPPIPAPIQYLTEQIWIEYTVRLKSIPVGHLPTELNTQWWFPDFEEREPSAEFVHLAACPHKERMERFRELAATDCPVSVP
jgi:hypothetical protein